jgi:AAA domain
VLEPDRDQLETFTDALFRHGGREGFVSLRAFHDGSNKPFRITPTDLAGGFPYLLEVVEDDARRAAQDPKPIVFCPPIAVFSNKDKAREQDILLGLALSVECDQHPREALETLECLLGPATIVVASGGKWTDPETGEVQDRLHLHWRLRVPARGEALAKLKRARDIAARIVGGDPSNKSVCHPIRWPGSWHRKKEPVLCKIETVRPDTEIDLDAALDALVAAAPPPTTNGNGKDHNHDHSQPRDWDDLIKGVISGNDYHNALTSLAAKCLRAGTSKGATHNMLSALMQNSTGPRDARWQTRYDDISRAIDTAVAKGFDQHDAPADGKEEDFAPADLGPFDVGDFVGPAPERRWIVDDWIAEGVVNSIYGTGGVGKTLIAQQLAYCLAIGHPFLGIAVKPKTSFCVLCEDIREEIHRRHDAIKAGLGHEHDNPFKGKVTVWPRVGMDNLLVTWDHKNEPRLTPQFKAIWKEVLEKRPDLLVLDTLADIYGGNEIVRVQANHFIKTVLGRLILQAEAAGFTLTVLLLAHPSMGGIATGTGSSGSTAWENAVRARLYMRKPDQGHDDERELVRAKANYAAAGEETVLRMIYQRGCFVTGDAANKVAVDSAKEHMRGIVKAAWDAKRPYVSKKGHSRNIHTAGLRELLNRGVNKTVALQAIRQMIDDGDIYIKRRAWGDGFCCQGQDEEAVEK